MPISENKKLPNQNDRHWFEKFANILEQNIRGVQYGIYAVAVTGLVIAFRSVRPFKKFTRPQEIPASFFEKHIQLKGKVIGVDLSPKPVLIVDHSPIIGSRYRELSHGLPVCIEGIDITSNGVSWLQAVVVGKQIDFTLLQLQPQCVSCIVKSNQKSVANSLVFLGFASVSTFNQALENDELYKKYYQSLLKDEQRAENNGSGMWWDRTPTYKSMLLTTIFSKLPNLRLKS